MSANPATVAFMARTKRTDVEKKTETLSTRVTRHISERFTEIAEADNRTASNLLEMVVKAFLAEHDSPDSTRAAKTGKR